jgi:hypothetical protein
MASLEVGHSYKVSCESLKLAFLERIIGDMHAADG